MDDMKIFEHPDFGRIRTVELDGQGWLVGKDVAEVLGYEKPTDAIRKHVPEEDRGISKMETPSGSQNMTIINESGLYSLIFSSKLPSAKAFKQWVTSEVLPSIRKHGAYLTPETIQNAILNPDTLIQLATALKDEQNKNRALQADNSKLLVGLEIARPKAEYFDELVNRSGLTSFRETAKELGVQPKKLWNTCFPRSSFTETKRENCSRMKQRTMDILRSRNPLTKKRVGAERKHSLPRKGEKCFWGCI